MKLIRKRILLKAFAVFFLLEIITSAVAPAVSWALTSGPTAPEATSFEPVDTTDMVNLNTGDLAYNLPLLEVPGPSGGYPLSLSYHAGIQPNEDASWTGLGWTLNPGAITRNVNGFADDHQSVANASRYFWAGGSTSTYSVGVTVGAAGTPASVSFGLSYSQDTYRGVGYGSSMGFGMGVGGKKSPFDINASVSVDPYGGTYVGAGIGVSIRKSEKEAYGMSADVGLSTNFNQISGSTQVGSLLNGWSSSVGVSMASGQGTSAGAAIAGATYSSNSRSGRMSQSSTGFSLAIPVYYGVFVNLGYKYHRYWIDQVDQTNVSGALYYPTPDPDNVFSTHYFDHNNFDTYSTPDPNFMGSNPDAAQGGTFPNFDHYYVNAQGLAGMMRPYYFQKHLYKRNNYRVDDDNDYQYTMIQYDLNRSHDPEDKRAEFRFLNDFSNRFEYDPAKLEPTEQPIATDMQYSFNSGTTKIGEFGTEPYTSNQIQGSRSVLWFTNEEIIQKAERVRNAGFIETTSTGYDRDAAANASKAKQIGGYTIINESGMKYHFALPAYSYDEYMYSGKKTGVETFNDFHKDEPYAYTWYLTAITGPDYVDRGPSGAADGVLNEYDWGYWVNFEYGKWSDSYAWRNPSEAMSDDVDGDFQNFSEGRKELYYLDAIKTKTHTALFFKDIRHDAKGSVYFERNYKRRLATVWGVSRDKQPQRTIIAQSKTGGFIPTSASCTCQVEYWETNDQHENNFMGGDNGRLDYIAMPTSSMKLNSIILIKNEDLKEIPLSKALGDYSQNYAFGWTVSSNGMPAAREQCDFSNMILIPHHGENVLDKYDLAQVETALTEKTIRRVRFDTDYSLSPGTANSFDYAPLHAGSVSTNPSSYPRMGKLTLNALHFDGVKGADVLPPMQFSYDLDQPVLGAGTLSWNASTLMLQTSTQLSPGDILAYSNSGRTYYVVITAYQDGNLYTVKALNGGAVPGGITFRTTKNPPYDKDALDMWGLYKSDYIDTDEPLFDHLVTDISGKSLDAWSLRNVWLPTGAKLSFGYESDDYKEAVISSNYDFQINKMKRLADGTVEIKFPTWMESATLTKTLLPGAEVAIVFLSGDRNNPNANNAVDAVGTIQQFIRDGDDDIKDFYHTLIANSPLAASRAAAFYYGHFYPINKVGGGVKVASVDLADGQRKRITRYNYSHDGRSSGSTSYEPSLTAKAFLDNAENWNDNRASNGHNLLAVAREIPAPGVMYEYVTVSEEVVQHGETFVVPQKTEYHFQPFTTGTVGVDYQWQYNTALPSQKKYENYIGYSDIQTRKVYLKDYSSRVGTLRGVKLYDDQGRVMTETINHYLNDQTASQDFDNNRSLDDDFERNWKLYERWLERDFKGQGVMEETFTEGRFYKRPDDDFVQLGVITKREQFPSIQIGQTVINYRTEVVTNKSTVAFDYYSGQVISSREIDSYGNRYQTDITPAYRLYPAMGQASTGGKNMLTQEAASYTYRVEATGNTPMKLGLLAASVTTWSDSINVSDPERNVNNFKQFGIWRKRAGYSFVGASDAALEDGLYKMAFATPFAAWNNEKLPAGSPWLKTGETTLYDPYSRPLEAKDVYERYAAVKLSSGQQGVLGAATNARYNEFACTGMEDIKAGVSGGGVMLMGGVVDYAYKHTGRASARIASGTQGLYANVQASTAVGNQMHVSFWVHKPTASKVELLYQFAAGGAGPVQEDEVVEFDLTKTEYAGDWYLCEADISVPTNSGKPLLTFVSQVHNSGGSPIYVDDLRVHSIRTGMTTYVYNTWGSVTHILDNNNLYTRYDYDAIGRLTSTRKETFQRDFGGTGVVKLNQVVYHYGEDDLFKVTLTASNEGSTGSVRPLGSVEVAQNGEQTFELIDACSPSKFSGLWVDGKSISLTQPTTLLDGTVIKRTGNIITVSNIQSSHSIRTSFAVNSTLGRVECAKSDYGNGRYCYEGFWNWTYLDDCGEPIEWNTAMQKGYIPANLQSLAIDNCCTLSPAGAGCGCYDLSDKD
ncbi:hypothetical protein [Parachryseolinea silvisoli]|uniref:hypothetical protein n=1 Tax=Parachryseolinea silvisoli TaxID=2873601 RepID=UPI002265ED24|nr:hypothetical protein [Parachryseolinea silvisoli]MCD9019643.1 hypothetical protein [Parachryseolinea silvisoli]